MSAVPSVEPSSTTMTSTGWSDASRERTAASIPALSLYAGTITLTGSVTGAPQGLRRIRTCRRAATNTAIARSRLIAPAAHSSHDSTSRIQPLVRSAAISAMPCHRSAVPALRTAVGRATASPTVANVQPDAFSRGTSCSSAVTVWERSPPASCSSTIWPVEPAGVAAAAIASAPGRRQS